jgi:hypothetical protein
MNFADYCVICGNRNLKRYNAIVVPFIAERIFQKKAFHVWLMKCKTCGFQFFDLRFDDAELCRLYSDYRNESYISQRNRNEPWYTRKLNDSLLNKLKTWTIRKKSLVQNLTNYEPNIEARIKSILDFGGDKGQLIDGIFGNTRKYVYEISNVELLPGIERAACPSKNYYDLIVCSNVLEHISYPDKCIKFMHKMGNEGSVLYIEVPEEQPYSFYTLSKRLIQQILLLFSRPMLFLCMLKPGMFTHMHEHVNYFSKKSIQYLLEHNGYKDIQVNLSLINKAKVICAFARK